MAEATQFVETAALLAVMEEDEAKLDLILDGMLPGELGTFFNQVGTLQDCIYDRMMGSTYQGRRRRL